MTSKKDGSEALNNLSGEQLSELVESFNEWDQEEERISQEEKEEEERRISAKKPLMRLRKSPIEMINRSLFFVFIGSFLFTFVSIYNENRSWFFLYLISAFSCILYTPNRKALKELLDAWPNIKDLVKGGRR